MTARLVALHGLWAIQPEGCRPEFTRFPVATDPEKVRRQVQREFPGWLIELPTATGWLFEVEELRECEMSASPLFEEVGR